MSAYDQKKTLKGGHAAGLGDYLLCCAVSSDRKWVLSGSSDETLKIWDVETGECTQTMNGHTGNVLC